MKKRYFLVLFLCFALSYTQDRYLYELQGPGESWLSIPVNPVTGTFSALNLRETNTDFSALLFSGPAMSSHIGYLINGKSYHQSNFQINVPIGPTAGYQVDGVFQSPEGIHIETAYFLMDISLNSELKTMGVAVLLSNKTSSPHTVGVKILLDTDIGESQNVSLVNLPNGAVLSRPVRFPSTNLPSYIYMGDRGLRSPTLRDRGFYIYPYISTNTPTMVVVENWKRLATSPWYPETLGNTFSFTATNFFDVGIGIYFGEQLIEPNQEITLGIAISLDRINPIPAIAGDSQKQAILTDEAFSQGIFTPERYIINEMLANPDNPMLEEILNQRKFSSLVPGRGLMNNQILPSQEEDIADPIVNFRHRRAIDQNILEKNIEMRKLYQIYNESLGFEISPQKGYSQPPAKGMILNPIQK
ncbi:MAG: hypothetical protein ACRC9L_09025 [Brevinema sp.]